MTSSTRFPRVATKRVVRFLQRLRSLPPAMWQQLARAGAAPSAVHSKDDVIEELADYAARQRLRQALDAVPTLVPAIRARVDAAFRALEGSVPAATIRRMRRIARVAALALAVEPMLSPDDVRRLCRPLTGLLPDLQPALG
jgi:hypothetical protein